VSVLFLERRHKSANRNEASGGGIGALLNDIGFPPVFGAAVTMGKALPALKIPSGEVFTSPTYRALENSAAGSASQSARSG
jgi:hypothetical protein